MLCFFFGHNFEYISTGPFAVSLSIYKCKRCGAKWDEHTFSKHGLEEPTVRGDQNNG